MVWGGTSEVIDPTAKEEVKRYVVGMVVPDLAENGVIPGSEKEKSLRPRADSCYRARFDHDHGSDAGQLEEGGAGR